MRYWHYQLSISSYYYAHIRLPSYPKSNYGKLIVTQRLIFYRVNYYEFLCSLRSSAYYPFVLESINCWCRPHWPLSPYGIFFGKFVCRFGSLYVAFSVCSIHSEGSAHLLCSRCYDRFHWPNRFHCLIRLFFVFLVSQFLSFLELYTGIRFIEWPLSPVLCWPTDRLTLSILYLWNLGIVLNNHDAFSSHMELWYSNGTENSVGRYIRLLHAEISA